MTASVGVGGRRVSDQPLPPLLDESLDRLAELPDGIWDCEACGSEDAMLLAESSFAQFGVDLTTLSCVFCRYNRRHELGVNDPDQFDRERQQREREYGKRGININTDRDHIDAPRADVKAKLRELGYYD